MVKNSRVTAIIIWNRKWPPKINKLNIEEKKKVENQNLTFSDFIFEKMKTEKVKEFSFFCSHANPSENRREKRMIFTFI